MMKFRFFLLQLFFCSLFASAQVQEGQVFSTQGKYRGSLADQVRALQRQKMAAPGAHIAPLWVTVKCTDVDVVSNRMKEWDIYHSVVSDSLITVQTSVAWIDSIGALPQVLTLSGSPKARLRMDRALKTTQAYRVHQGEQLETPFTGKGVIVAVVDQGFELNHPAFSDADGKLRIKHYWNRFQPSSKPLTSEAEISAARYDGLDEEHGTHVAGIAAGSKVHVGTELSGQAPDAELIIVSSTLQQSEVLENVKYIHSIAKSQNKPCVVNMSFGQILGSHSGYEDNDKTLDAYAGEGFVLVQAAGNSNDKSLHVAGNLGNKSKPLRFGFHLDPSSELLQFGVYSREAQARPKDLKVNMYVYNPRTQTKKDVYSAFLAEGGVYPAPETNDGRWGIWFMHENLPSFIEPDCYLLMEMYSEDAANSLYDVWLEDVDDTQFLTSERVQAFNYVPGDTEYQVEPDGRRTLQVGAYCTRSEWKSLSGRNFYTDDEVGDLTYFSSGGPVVGEWYPAPVVTAPGSYICAPYSKTPAGTNLTTDEMTIYKTNSQNETFYYGLMRGTSMACPQVTGIVACWLQADPTLTPEEITQIIQKTAINDDYTGEVRNNWHRNWGYGKINAYEGLKMVLRRASDVRSVWDTTEPITINRKPGSWQLLFNSSESQADIRLTTSAGVPVWHHRLQNVSAGHEEVVSLQGLARGVYILTVQTAAALQTRTFVY